MYRRLFSTNNTYSCLQRRRSGGAVEDDVVEGNDKKGQGRRGHYQTGPTQAGVGEAQLDEDVVADQRPTSRHQLAAGSSRGGECGQRVVIKNFYLCKIA